jgi:hypothetical protein
MNPAVRYEKHEQLLLFAVLGDSDVATRAWREWQQIRALDDVDFGSQRLLPLLFRNLVKHGVDDPSLVRLKGVCRHTWSKNQVTLKAGASVLSSLAAEGIDTMVLKGAALVMGGYLKSDERTMNDFDLLVRPEHLRASLALLERLGWKPSDEGPQRQPTFLPNYVKFWHSHGFRDRGGRHLDLHWHVLHQCCYEAADDAFWGASLPLEWQGVSTRMLGPADQLLHLCVHGMYGQQSEGVAVLRWVPDAIAVIRRHADAEGTGADVGVDWQRLVEQSRARRLIMPVRAALEFLADLPGTVVPNSVLLSLQSMTPDPLERREFLAQRGRTGPLGYVPILWLQYRRNCEATGGRATFAGFLDFLQSLWGVERHEMPGVALGMGWQLFRRRFAAEPKHGRSTR